MRVLLTAYAHCIPGCDKIASQQIEHALSLSQWPPLAHKNPRERRESRPLYVRATAGLSGTQLDQTPPVTTTGTFLTCGNADRGG